MWRPAERAQCGRIRRTGVFCPRRERGGHFSAGLRQDIECSAGQVRVAELPDRGFVGLRRGVMVRAVCGDVAIGMVVVMLPGRDWRCRMTDLMHPSRGSRRADRRRCEEQGQHGQECV